MFCKKCGKQIESGSWFCPYCGEMTGEETASNAQTSQPIKPTVQYAPTTPAQSTGNMQPTAAPVAATAPIATMPEAEHRKQVKRWAVASIILLGTSFVSMQLGILLPAFGDGNDMATALLYWLDGMSYSSSQSAPILELFLLLAGTVFLLVSLITHIVNFVQNGKTLARFSGVYQVTRKAVLQDGVKMDVWRAFSGRKGVAPWASEMGVMICMGLLMNEGNPVAWLTLMFVVLLQLAGCIVEVVVAKKKLNELFVKA